MSSGEYSILRHVTALGMLQQQYLGHIDIDLVSTLLEGVIMAAYSGPVHILSLLCGAGCMPLTSTATRIFPYSFFCMVSLLRLPRIEVLHHLESA